ncbi:hypothetical protein FRB90_009993 [Tulasnella sp. 427]|nr:hypothetical protein FRB90_009993 [Tulasnella sp. 427]
MVRFERNWSRGERGVQKTITFQSHRSYPIALIPGGRWLLEWQDTPTGGVVSYDLDDVQSGGRVLIPVKREDQTIASTDFLMNESTGKFGFHLAVEFLSDDQFYQHSEGPRDLTIWNVTLGEESPLSAKLVCSIPVFQPSPPQYSLSLAKNSVLRMSVAGSDQPRRQVFTIHRWGGADNDEITQIILVPTQGSNFWATGQVALLSDGRILRVSSSLVEIYPQPDTPWKESLDVPDDLPETSPQWAYKYPLPFANINYSLSRPFHTCHPDSTRFSIYTGEFLLSFRIPHQAGLDPDVTTITLGEKSEDNRLGLGTSRAALTKWNETEATLVTFSFLPGIRSLHTFAGLGFFASTEQIVETRLVAFDTANANPWMLDEESGRMLCFLGMETPEYVVLCFVD